MAQIKDLPAEERAKLFNNELEPFLSYLIGKYNINIKTSIGFIDVTPREIPSQQTPEAKPEVEEAEIKEVK